MKNPGQQIIAGFKEGSMEAFAAVYNIHYRPLYYFVKKMINDPEEAQDITAATFAKLWNLKANFETQENIKAFLYITARNASLDYLRNQKKLSVKKQELSYVIERQEEQISLVNQVIEAEVLERIHQEIEKLPAKCRRIFKMAWLQGMKNAEIAETLQLNEQTVKNQKSKAVKRLRMVFSSIEIGMVVLSVFLQIKS